MAGICSEPLNSSGAELQPFIGSNEETWVQGDVSGRRLCCNSRTALAFLKPQLVLPEHALSSPEKEIRRLSTPVRWLWMSEFNAGRKINGCLGTGVY